MNRREFLRNGAIGLGVSSLIGASGLNPLTPNSQDSKTSTPPNETTSSASNRTDTPTPDPAPSFELWSHDTVGTFFGFTAASNTSDVAVVIGNSISWLDAESGERIWQAKSEQSIEAPVAVGDESVFGVGRSGRLVAINKENGDRRWFNDTGAFSPDQPMIHDETVLLPVTHSHVYAFGQESGDQQWVSSPKFTNPGTFKTDEYLYVVDGRNFAKLRLDDGSVVWEGGNGSRAYRPPDLNSNLMLDPDQELLLGTGGSRLYAADTSNGELVWEAVQSGYFQSLVLRDSQIYYVVRTDAENSMFGALDLATQENRWKKISPVDIEGWNYGTVTTELTIYEGNLLAGTSTGYLVRLNPDEGTLIGAISIFERPIERMAIDQDRAYLASDNQILGIILSEAINNA